MKKICLLFLILISNITFSQTFSDSFLGKYDKMADLFNHRKDEEAKKIADELLSGKYGEIDPFSKFFTLFSVANYYYQKDDYQKAYDFYHQFLDFNKNENPKKIDNKYIYIDEAKGKLEELKPKLSLVSTTTTNTAELTDAAKDELSKTSETKLENVNITSENSAVQAVKKETNTDKTVTLTVSGTGKTLEEARLNALRSAIEQAFGAFISSKTEILNDNLIKDEIVSVANGNVQKYDVISQVETPNSGFLITLSAKVSIEKLTSFAESKGVTIEFKGGLFATNMKLKKLNEESEEKIIFELFGILHEKFQTSFDYSIETKDPILSDVKWGDEIARYNIPLKVEALVNQNYDLTVNHLIKVLNSLSLNKSELLEYANTKKVTYKIVLKYNLTDYSFNLRTKLSFDLLKRLAESWEFYVGCFNVDNGLNVFQGPIGKVNFEENFNEYYNYYMPFIVPLRKESWNPRIYTNGKIDVASIFEISGSEKNELLIDFSGSPGSFSWMDIYTLGELERITNYTVKSSGIISKFKHGGYILYENNGEGIVAYPLIINKYNIWGGDLKLGIGTSAKLFTGKMNTDKIAATSDKNIGKYFQKLNYAGYNDWAIPSADELSLVMKKVYLLGIGDRMAGSLYSSTELQNKYFNDFKNVITFNLTHHYGMFLKNFKWVNLKNEFSLIYDYRSNEKLDISVTGGLDSDSTYGNTFQPIRYFKN